MGESRRGNFIHTVFKMNVTTWLSLVIAVIALATPANTSEPRVVCYYTNWSVYRPGAARFNPQNINPYLCTHLVYAFGGFTKDNALKPFDRYQDIEKGGYAKFTGLKTYNKKLKTMLAIGGWNEGSTRFSPMVAARDRRKEFVRNAIKFLRQNHFDGLDLDWEYPAFRDGGKPKDRENYAKLVKELREEFEREAEKTGKPRLLLTMAVPAGIEYIQKGFDVQTLNQYLDWMNLLTYDYHSAFEPAVNHHAPLYPLEEPNEYSVDTELNIDYTIKFYLENGADRDKLVLGIPTYGRSYTLFNPDAVEIGAPADGPGEQGDATREKGYLAYYEICEALKPKTKKRSARSEEDSEEDSEEEEEEEEWTVTYPNAKAMGPVAYKGNQWVGYDDIEIVKRKAEYVAENGLGGIMFWSIDNDDFRGTCHDKPYPLIEAAKEAYIVSLGSTDNAIVTERASPARSSSRRRSRPRSSTTTTTAKPSTAAKIKSNNRKNSVTSTTPAWNVITPEPPTTPDPGSDFKCTDEGFFPHPRDCKKYFWCLDSGPSNLGIVAHQFTCPSGLFFNKAADSCDFARNVLCKKPSATTKAPTTKAPTTTTTPITTTTTRRPVKLSTRNSLLFRTSTTTTTTTTTTPEPESEEYSEEQPEDSTDIEAEDPKVIKELIDLIKKVGGVEQLEKHLRYGETSASTDGAKTTTPSVFNKKLYQKVLERTRGKTKSSNTISEGSQNSRRGPQNAGLEPAADKDRLLRKDRPQYTTINRSRPSTQAPEPEESEEEEDISEEQTPAPSRARAVEPERSVATTAKPLQYVNIRRARPTTLTTSDTADDTASRNALFERSEPYVTVSDSSNSLDIVNARRENIPEYVTIRRQRPTTEEATTVPYENTVQETESQDTVLEREISSQPQYTSILRARSTTEATIEEPSSPEPTTVLAVQISSLLNTPNSSEDEEETSPAEVEITETTSASTTTTSRPTTTTTTTTTTPAPPSPPRRTVLRRRGSTTTTTAAPTSAPTTQVSSRNYSFVRRRRPLSRPNDISPDSGETDELSRKIRSTTPDSREVDGVKNVETSQFRRNRIRLTPQNDDSVPAAASPVARGQFRPQLSRDEVISLTPIDLDTPQLVQKPSPAQRTERRFRPRTSTTSADNVADSEVSAATIEVRRPNIVPRGRSRFSISTQTPITEPTVSTASGTIQTNTRRSNFARFSPRPFTRSGITPATSDDPTDEIEQEATPRPQQRVPFSRNRPSFGSPQIQARKLPFPSRSTTEQSLVNDDDVDDEVENKNDIALSESAIEEKEHNDEQDNIDDEAATPETPKRRVVIKKLRAPTSAPDNAVSTETIPIEESGKRKFRVIRRRPSSTTEAPEPSELPIEPSTSAPTKVRRIIRKKIKPVEDEPQIIAKSIGSLKSEQVSSTTEFAINYGEKTRVTLPPSSEAPTTLASEEELLKLEDDIEFQKKEVPTQIEEHANEQIVDNAKLTEDEASNQNDEMEEKTTEATLQDNNTEQPKPEVVIETEQKTLDISETKEVEPTEASVTEAEEFKEEKPETTTASTTVSTSPSSRARLPYRPPKRLFTSTTESSLPSSSKTFSRKYNPGVYTSPASVDKPDAIKAVTRRPLFNSKIFTRRPFTTARTTQKIEDEEYSDEEILDEEPENPFVFVPQNQLFSRKPDGEEDDEEEYDSESGEITDDEPEEEEPEPVNKYTTRKPGFKPRVVNSNTFRASTTTTELPKRPFPSGPNRTAIFNRFGSNRPVDNKKRVQNVPQGYNVPVAPSTKLSTTSDKSETTTVQLSNDEEPITTTSADFEMDPDGDDYLSMTESTFTQSDTTNTDAVTSTNFLDSETTTEMEISTGDYLEYTEGTTNYPSTQDLGANTQADTEANIDIETERTEEITTEPLPQTTSPAPPPQPIVKTQFDKLFSVSRVVEVSSKLDKHRLNKNNETTLIEEGKVMIEQKPIVDKIGEVSRFSLIKIVEDEIPLYLTKLGHVYPVENPPDHLIRIDEARNARALNNFNEGPKENLVASESINEGYRHVKNVNKENGTDKDIVEHLLQDDFLSYINDDKKADKSTEQPDSYTPEWQFVPAAYENEKKSIKAAKSFEIVTPRSMRTEPSTLPLQGLFKTEMPLMARKVSDISNKDNQPFVVYSASVPTQNEDVNIVKLDIIKPETGRSIVTFAKGQEFKGAAVAEQATIKYPIDISVIPLPLSSTTEAIVTSSSTTTTESVPTSPLIDILTTTQAIPTPTEAQTTTTEELSTTETVPEETTTQKISPLDAKRSKFAFPRRPIIKASNFTRPVPRTLNNIKKINATVVSNLNQKANKTTGFNPSKSRFGAIRSQNVPVDLRKKPTTKVPRTFSTEAPRTTTERKLYIKPIRPAFRPAFVPRKATAAPQTNEGSEK